MARRSILPVAVVASVTLIGCGGDDGAPAVAPSVTFNAPASADGTPPEQLALPLTSIFWRSRTDEQLIGMAANLVTSECMAREGFEVPPYRFEEPLMIGVPRPFGPWTEDDVADGYGPNIGETHLTALDEFLSDLPPDVAPEWNAAYRGDEPFGGGFTTVTLPDGTEVESGFAAGYRSGCEFAGFDAVFGDYAAREELRQEIEALVNEAAVEAEDDSGVVDQSLEVWHDCMEAVGIAVAGGGEGPDKLRIGYISEPGLTEEEQRVAAEDVRCKAEANLHDAYFSERAKAEQRLIEENELFVEAWRELVQASLERARQIVSDGGG